jgi:hypothetical protein
MSKEQVLDIKFNEVPDARIRVIQDSDTNEIKKQKLDYPFELFNTVTVTIKTTFREFSFDIYNGYYWNGADIPRFLWRIVGSRTDNQFLIASMLHDYILQFRKYMLKEVLHNMITVSEYRRLTSLIFREKLKAQGTNTIKANIMSWCVDVYQHYGNKRGWKIN